MPDWTFKTTRWPAALFAALFALGCGSSSSQTTNTAPAAPPPDPYGAEAQDPYETEDPGLGEPSGAPPADAWESPEGAPGASNEGGTISDEEIDSYSQIQIDLAPLQDELTQKAREGASQAELQDLQLQLQERATEIVEGSGMTAERFNEITALVQRDPDLMRRVQIAIEEKMGS